MLKNDKTGMLQSFRNIQHNITEGVNEELEKAFNKVREYAEIRKQKRNQPLVKRQPLFKVEGTEFGVFSGLTSIFANEGEGKSQLANILCFNALRTKQDRKVIVLDTEQGADEVIRREITISYEPNDNLEVIYYPDFCDAIKECQQDPWEVFKAFYLDSLNAGDVVVVDVVSDIVGDINDPDKAHLMAQDLQQLADKKRCAVIVVNHYNKNTTNSAGWIGTELLKKSANIIHVQRAFKKEQSLSKMQEVASTEGFKFVAISGIVEVSGNIWQIGKCRFLYGQWFGWDRCRDDNSRKVLTIGEVDGVESYDNVEYYKIIGDTSIEAGAVQMNARREQLRDKYHIDEIPEEGLSFRGTSSAFLQWVKQYDAECGDGSGIMSELESHELILKDSKKHKVFKA